MSRPILALTRHAACLAAWLARRGSQAQFIAGLLALGLGLWGWVRHEPPHAPSDYFNTLFRTLQLITLQFPHELQNAIPWQLQVGRLLVPLVAALATLNLLVGSITRPLRLAMLHWESDHIIVCGAERLTEAALRTLAERRRQIIIVAPSFDATRRDALEGLGLTCAEADPALPETFATLNLRRASALFLTHEDDLANLDLAMIAMPLLATRPADMPPLVLGVLVDDEVLAGELDAALDGISRQHNVRYHRLCPDREGLRRELRRYAPALLKPVPAARTHIMVIGLAGRWQQALAQLVLCAQDHPNERPLFSLLLDKAEASLLSAWCAARPQLPLVAEFAVLTALPTEAPVGWLPPQLAVVLQPDAQGISTALALRRRGHPLGTEALPVLVRQSREDRLLAPLGQVTLDGRSLREVVPFGGVLRPESIERVLDRCGDDIAMALHAEYKKAAPGLGGGSAASIEEWEMLPENLRDANRASADHMAVLFAAASLRIGNTGQDITLNESELDLLARVEHRRWCADRIERGWRYGARDNALLLHPSLRDFDELPPDEQEKDRVAVRTLAAVLSKTGRALQRG